MNISYDWYKIFFWAAECNSITLAAEKLYISQPAVSQCIRQLEEAIGCPLFIRTPKGVKLTAEGKTLYTHISDGVNAFSEGERRLTAMLRLDAGEIRIGASDMTLEFCLLAYLERFHKKYPNIKISITNNPTPQTLELLRHGKIDFAVVSEPFSCEDFEAVPVREIQDIFICKSTCDIANNVSISEFQEQFIMLEKNTSTRTFLDKELRGRGINVSPKFELATSSLIVSFTAKNMGIGCVVADFAKDAIAEGCVKEIKVCDPLPPRKICVVRSPEKISKAADALLKIILE